MLNITREMGFVSWIYSSVSELIEVTVKIEFEVISARARARVYT